MASTLGRNPMPNPNPKKMVSHAKKMVRAGRRGGK